MVDFVVVRALFSPLIIRIFLFKVVPPSLESQTAKITAGLFSFVNLQVISLGRCCMRAAVYCKSSARGRWRKSWTYRLLDATRVSAWRPGVALLWHADPSLSPWGEAGGHLLPTSCVGELPVLRELVSWQQCPFPREAEGWGSPPAAEASHAVTLAEMT